MKISPLLVLVGFMLSCGSTVSADIILNDGFVHNFPPETASEPVQVWDGPGATTTTVNLLDGGLIEGYLQAFESSEIHISGGRIEGDLTARASSNINISGGSVLGHVIIGVQGGSATAIMSGGTIGYFAVHGTASAIMTGGSVDTDLVPTGFAIAPAAQGDLTITGGTINGSVRVLHESTLRIEGGSFATSHMSATDSAHLTIVGSNFNLPYGDYHAGSLGTRLTGTLADGSPLDIEFVNAEQSATVTLQQVPEPGTFSVLIGLGLVGLLYRGKRRGR